MTLFSLRSILIIWPWDIFLPWEDWMPTSCKCPQVSYRAGTGEMNLTQLVLGQFNDLEQISAIVLAIF